MPACAVRILPGTFGGTFARVVGRPSVRVNGRTCRREEGFSHLCEKSPRSSRSNANGLVDVIETQSQFPFENGCQCDVALTAVREGRYTLWAGRIAPRFRFMYAHTSVQERLEMTAGVQALTLTAEEQLAMYPSLTDAPTDLLMIRLAEVTAAKRKLEEQIKQIEDIQGPLEDIVKERMKTNGTLSQKVQTPNGDKMSFALSVKMYPKMLVSSDQVVDAVERLAMRLEHEGRAH